MRTTINAIRKALVFVLGASVFILGLVLLVLPGPGLLVMIAGLLILSLEFEWAKHHRDRAKAKFDEVTKRNKK